MIGPLVAQVSRRYVGGGEGGGGRGRHLFSFRAPPPHILESTPFSLRIQIFPRPNVMGFFADLLFSSLESGLKNICIRRMCVDGSRFRNQKVADSKITR